MGDRIHRLLCQSSGSLVFFLSRAFWLNCGSAFEAIAHDEAHDVFMALPPYTRTREGVAPPGSWPATLLAGPLSEETLSIYQKTEKVK
jgi:hypothetical protein